MSKKVNSSLFNKSIQNQLSFKGLSQSEISQIERLNMFEQAEKVKSILKSTIEANDLSLAHLLNNQERLELLKREQPNNTDEIKRISMVIKNIEEQKSKKQNRIDKLELNLDERAAILEELLKSKNGRALTLLPPVPKNKGKKKKKTRKRKKAKKAKKNQK